MDIRDTQSFKLKKWLLFGFCAFTIIMQIILAALATVIVNKLKDDYDKLHTDVKWEDFKTAALVMIYIVVVISILFDLLGLMGSYKEHYCMTMTYAVLRSLTAIGSIWTATSTPTYWVSCVFSFVVAILAWLFAFELRKRRRILFGAPGSI